jgi:hypothetical protein
MIKMTKTWFKVGLAFTVLGSFMPWWGEGDLFYYVRSGIDVNWSGFAYWVRGQHAFPLEDNGGTLVLVLSIMIGFLDFRTRCLIARSEAWTLICAIALFLASIFHVITLVWERFKIGNDLVGPYIHIGLPVVIMGTLFLLYASVYNYRKYWIHNFNTQGEEKS